MKLIGASLRLEKRTRTMYLRLKSDVLNQIY